MTAPTIRERRVAEKGIFERIGDAFRGESTPIEKAAVPTQTLGSSNTGVDGLDYSGEAYSLERNLNLLGPARFVEYDRMMRDVSIIAAGLRLLFGLIANAVWTVNPPDGLSHNEEAVAQGYADAAYDILFDMTSSWSTVVRKTAMFRFQGFAILEWTAIRRDDGTIGFKDVEHRPQRTIVKWDRDESGTVVAVKQRVSGGQGEVTLPRSKIVYAVDDTLTDSPEGMGLFRHLAITADRLRQFLELEEVGFTTDLRGIPIARAPLAELMAEVKAAGPEGSDERKKAESRRQKMLAPLRDLVTKHMRNKHTGAMLPSDTFIATTPDKAQTPSSVHKWELELLNGDSTSFADLANAVNRMNQELARVLGVEHLLLGSDGSGSLALARSKVGTFYQIVTSTLLDLVEVFDRDLIGPLAEMNGWPEELRPELGVNEISDRDIEQVAQALSLLANAGIPMMPGDPAEGELYDMLGLSRPPEDRVALDDSLNPGRKDPSKDPNAPDDALPNNPEDKVKKIGLLKSRKNRGRRRRRMGSN
jgi:hypothetical protein